MTCHDFAFCGTTLTARPTGALWWEHARMLVVSDLHLGKSDRHARRAGIMLPPYEIDDTLARLDADIAATNPTTVVCLGDSFDDLAAQDALRPRHLDQITAMQAGRTWVWIEGNHDPGPVDLSGQHLATYRLGPLTFRHIATSKTGEISGHYHPKCSLGKGGARPAFLTDETRIIMPAFGTYTGGLNARHPTLQNLMHKDATAILTGRKALPVPLAATV